MVQISSGGFLPLSIWTSYFGLGQMGMNFSNNISYPV